MTAVLLAHRDEANLCREPSALDWPAALYFSALGVASVSLLLPCVGLSWFVTFWPKGKELLYDHPPRLPRAHGAKVSAVFLP